MNPQQQYFLLLEQHANLQAQISDGKAQLKRLKARADMVLDEARLLGRQLQEQPAPAAAASN